MLKYARNYLARDLDCLSRAEILSYHYTFLNDYMAKDFSRNVINNYIILWKKNNIDNYSVVLTFSRFDKEGDLSLRFNSNNIHLYTLSFTIVPGNAIGVDHETVLFITRSQGTCGNFDIIKSSTKKLKELSPFLILLAAAQAIATSLDIKVVAVSAKFQIVTGWTDGGEGFTSKYDHRWLSMGGIKINEMVYELPSLPCSKPLSMIKRCHRSRAKRKRRDKIEIYNQVMQTFGQRCLR